MSARGGVAAGVAGVALGSLLAGCGGAGPGAREPSSGAAGQYQPGDALGMSEGEHLLLLPHAAPEQLLGRPVTQAEDGGWQVADERRPGCSVEVRPRNDSFTREYTQRVGEVASVGAGFALLGKLRGKYGNELVIRSQVTNTQLLEADLSGDCGELVVREVRVGTGARQMLKRKSVEGEASVPVAGVEAGGASWDEVEGKLEWKEPQGWGFRVGPGPTSALQVKVEVPPELADCSSYRYSVSASAPAWFVIVNDFGGDEVNVLWPHRDAGGVVRDVSVAGAGEVSTLDGKAFLLQAAKPAKESLAFYAFSEEAEYRRLRPEPSGTLTREQLKAFQAGFEAIPSKRRQRLEYTYNILPLDPPRVGECR